MKKIRAINVVLFVPLFLPFGFIRVWVQSEPLSFWSLTGISPLRSLIRFFIAGARSSSGVNFPDSIP